MKGTVKRWLRGYGFIDSEGHDEDLFVHNSDVQGGSELMHACMQHADFKSVSVCNPLLPL